MPHKLLLIKNAPSSTSVGGPPRVRKRKARYTYNSTWSKHWRNETFMAQARDTLKQAKAHDLHRTYKQAKWAYHISL
jgi:hypothetical protein